MSPICLLMSPTSLCTSCHVGPYVPYTYIRDIRDMNNPIVRARERCLKGPHITPAAPLRPLLNLGASQLGFRQVQL